jgi:hypothetical protein
MSGWTFLLEEPAFVLLITKFHKNCGRICRLYYSEFIVSEKNMGMIILVALIVQLLSSRNGILFVSLELCAG